MTQVQVEAQNAIHLDNEHSPFNQEKWSREPEVRSLLPG